MRGGGGDGMRGVGGGGGRDECWMPGVFPAGNSKLFCLFGFGLALQQVTKLTTNV
jgi:hypothetical protein